MRVRSVQIKVLLILSLSVAARSSAQVPSRIMDNPLSPEPIKGVPFTASWQQSIWDHGVVTSQSTWRVARAGDGRTYCATLAAEGLPYEIDIDDLPNNRMITVYPRNQTYKLSTPLGGKFRAWSLEEFAKELEQFQNAYAEGVDHPPVRWSSLGVKQEDGMTLYGQRVEQTAFKQISEQWFSSDLGTRARLKGTSLTEERSALTVLRDIERVEPNPALFQIPEGYSEIK